MMERTLRDKWTTALRGGEYQQGHGQLILHAETGDTYHCCLGVLCELLGLPREEGGYRDAIEGEDTYTEEGPRRHGNLGAKRLDDLGITSAQQTTLVEMNDGTMDIRVHSFDEIADWIENNL